MAPKQATNRHMFSQYKVLSFAAAYVTKECLKFVQSKKCQQIRYSKFELSSAGNRFDESNMRVSIRKDHVAIWSSHFSYRAFTYSNGSTPMALLICVQSRQTRSKAKTTQRHDRYSLQYFQIRVTRNLCGKVTRDSEGSVVDALSHNLVTSLPC